MLSALRFTLAAGLALALIPPAEARYACAVKRTSDGFVALREGPGVKHPVVARMKQHEMVGLLDDDRDDIVREGDWLKVTWYPGTRRTAMVTPDISKIKGRPGWVRDRLIDCFEE
jgi:hypothetical protein